MPHIPVRCQGSVPKARVPGFVVQQKPADRDLCRSREAGPRNGALPLAVEPAREKAVRPQCLEYALGGFVGALENLAISREEVAFNQTAQRISNRVG